MYRCLHVLSWWHRQVLVVAAGNGRTRYDIVSFELSNAEREQILHRYCFIAIGNLYAGGLESNCGPLTVGELSRPLYFHFLR